MFTISLVIIRTSVFTGSGKKGLMYTQEQHEAAAPSMSTYPTKIYRLFRRIDATTEVVKDIIIHLEENSPRSKQRDLLPALTEFHNILLNAVEQLGIKIDELFGEEE
jgi:hypothetical protein